MKKKNKFWFKMVLLFMALLIIASGLISGIALLMG